MCQHLHFQTDVQLIFRSPGVSMVRKACQKCFLHLVISCDLYLGSTGKIIIYQMWPEETFILVYLPKTHPRPPHEVVYKTRFKSETKVHFT